MLVGLSQDRVRVGEARQYSRSAPPRGSHRAVLTGLASALTTTVVNEGHHSGDNETTAPDDSEVPTLTA
jgi:hypothetical protein